VHPLLIVAGPTGTGKSCLAIHLALKFRGELVNCDSLQLYRGFDIGTAKTPSSERHGIAHHLFDVLEADSVHSAGEYSRWARESVAGISARGKLPIVVGGTGFYIRALLEGLPALPQRNEQLRVQLEDRETRRPGSLHRLLRRLEPGAAARLHPNDLQRLTRALEIRITTARPVPAAWEAAPLTGYRLLALGLDPGREALVQAIAQRTRTMFEAGLIDEVRGLLAGGLTGGEKPFEALGYKEALAHLRGELTLEQAREMTEIGTRQYAKRQMTWFRRESRMHWLRGFGSDAAIQDAAVAETGKLLLP
jgi:tRNA dimethylallyltransferase